MDLITYALLKKSTKKAISEAQESSIKIGENGNWFIKGIDTGLEANPTKNLVDVDGVLRADTEKQNLVVIKDGNETVVGEYTTSIENDKIANLFSE